MSTRRYGVTTDYDYSAEHKRQRLDVWSGPFYLSWEGTALSLKGGFMVTTYNGDKVRVACESPRTTDNYERVDAAISTAMNQYETERGSVSLQ